MGNLPDEVVNANAPSLRIFGNNVANVARGIVGISPKMYRHSVVVKKEEEDRIEKAHTEVELQRLFDKLKKLINNRKYVAIENMVMLWNKKLQTNDDAQINNHLTKLESLIKKPSPQSAGTRKKRKTLKRKTLKRKTRNFK